MASVLLGDVSPAGRLPTSIYPADFVLQRKCTDNHSWTTQAPPGMSWTEFDMLCVITGNITDMTMRPHDGIPGITYRFNEKLLFPFGYGRSYTTWQFEWSGTEVHCSHVSPMSLSCLSHVPLMFLSHCSHAPLMSLSFLSHCSHVPLIVAQQTAWHATTANILAALPK